MNVLKTLSMLLAVFLTAQSFPGIASNKPKAPTLNATMVEVGNTMVELYPLILAQRSYSQQEKQQVVAALSRLSQLFAQAEPFIKTRPDGYQVSYEFISQYLKVLATLLRTYPMDHLRTHLYAMGEICISCHTQDTTLRTLFAGVGRAQMPGDYAFAELNYMTREYDVALQYFQKYLDSSSVKTELDIILPLQRMITIYTQVQNRTEEAVTVLKKYLTHSKHTAATLQELKAWIEGMEQLRDNPINGKQVQDFSQLRTLVARYLGKPEALSLDIQSDAQQEVLRVWLRGQLYHYLNSEPPAGQVPMLLYWLSVTDRAIAYNFYFSLADLYLKQCVLKYPEHPYAKRCFAEFQRNVKRNYTDQGESIPAGIQQELQQMGKALARGAP